MPTAKIVVATYSIAGVARQGGASLWKSRFSEAVDIRNVWSVYPHGCHLLSVFAAADVSCGDILQDPNPAPDVARNQRSPATSKFEDELLRLAKPPMARRINVAFGSRTDLRGISGLFGPWQRCEW
jgi:hypothetical protein